MPIFAIDFDGTCVEHRYPAIGPDVPGAVELLHALVKEGHQLILWTMRSGQPLADAQEWFAQRGIPLLGVNTNPTQSTWTASPKAYAEFYIDDAALGCPVQANPRGGRPYVNWALIRAILQSKRLLPSTQTLC